MQINETFTPGNWRIDGTKIVSDWKESEFQDFDTVIVDCFASMSGKDIEADCRLMAEAKNMYSMTRAIIICFDNEQQYPPGTYGYTLVQDAKSILNRINKQHG